MSRTLDEIKVKILSGATESKEIDTSYLAILGLFVPTIDNSTLTFKVSSCSANFVNIKDKAGATISFTVGTGGIAISSEDLAFLAAYRFIKIVSSEPQTADRTFTWCLKE